MLDHSKNLITENFCILMKECNVDVLKQKLVDKEIYTQSEITKIFSSDDARHNKRKFFFSIQKKEEKAFHVLIQSLKETNQHKIVKLLVPEVKSSRMFSIPQETDFDDESLRNLSIYISYDKTPLNIKVKPSAKFLDTSQHNRNIYFYSSRSKKRGKVLIFNNYDYVDKEAHPYRNGAQVDNTNLDEMFNQMGGWEIHKHDNTTTEEMRHLILEFVRDRRNKEFDICFVIIMGHGEENLHRTIIFGKDGKFLSTNDIQKYFTNEQCVGFRGKPKVFLFQVCRGSALDHTIRHTETDGTKRADPSGDFQEVQEITDCHFRTQEDMLIGFATLHGYKAHRDPHRGSWYIELVCKVFMNNAHTHHVATLLQLVDQNLRRRMSEDRTMQTAEHSNRGFKNLYLHPGIYEEGGVLKSFHNRVV